MSNRTIVLIVVLLSTVVNCSHTSSQTETSDLDKSRSKDRGTCVRVVGPKGKEIIVPCN